MFGRERCDVYSFEDEIRVSGWERRLVVLKRSGAGAEKVRCCTAESKVRAKAAASSSFTLHVRWKWSKEQRRVAEQRRGCRRKETEWEKGMGQSAVPLPPCSGERGERGGDGSSGGGDSDSYSCTRATGGGRCCLKVTGGERSLEQAAGRKV